MANLVLTTPTNPGTASWEDGNALFGTPFPWYGSGTDGARVLADNIFYLPYYEQNTTITVSNSALFVGCPGAGSYIELMATESISITGSIIVADGENGNSASGASGGNAGRGSAGSAAGTAGATGTTGVGASQGENEVMNMTNKAGLGARALAGSGGSGTSGAGGDGGQSTENSYYLPPFRAMFIGGTAPRFDVAVGGYGGGAGAGDGVQAGGGAGGGGGGGGAIVMRAPTINITQCGLYASGGDGGNGASPPAGGNCGGGGGGSGGNAGVMIFVAENLNLDLPNMTIALLGGDAGSGAAGSGSGGLGGLGGIGASGVAYWYRPSTNTWSVVA